MRDGEGIERYIRIDDNRESVKDLIRDILSVTYHTDPDAVSVTFATVKMQSTAEMLKSAAAASKAASTTTMKR